MQPSRGGHWKASRICRWQKAGSPGSPGEVSRLTKAHFNCEEAISLHKGISPGLWIDSLGSCIGLQSAVEAAEKCTQAIDVEGWLGTLQAYV